MQSCKLFLCWSTSGGATTQSKQTRQNVSSRGELKVKSRCKSKHQHLERKKMSTDDKSLMFTKKQHHLSSHKSVCSTNRRIVPFCPARRSLLVTGLSPRDFSWHYVVGRRVLIALWCCSIFSYSICELFPYLLHLCRAETTYNMKKEIWYLFISKYVIFLFIYLLFTSAFFSVLCIHAVSLIIT